MQHQTNGAQRAKSESMTAAKDKILVAQQGADEAYQAALVAERAEVALLEGPSMREEIQAKVCVTCQCGLHPARFGI